jgi:hypothetical protein
MTKVVHTFPAAFGAERERERRGFARRNRLTYVRSREILSYMAGQHQNIQARLRARNQLTLPEPVVKAAGLREGDRFFVELSSDDPDTLKLHRIRGSYAGSLAEAYGDAEAALREERESWR